MKFSDNFSPIHLFKSFSQHELNLFFAGLFLKLALGSLLASEFVIELFLPFVTFYSSSGLENPYSHFIAAGKDNAFPYPAMMLYVMALPQAAISHDPATLTHTELFFFRLPLLVADLAVFAVLLSWLPGTSIRRLIWLYWLSPVLIYINYIHGQLDVIPIAFLIVALYYLFQEKVIISAIFIGFALASKTNVLLIYPLFFFFLYSRTGWLKDSLIFLSLSTAVFLLTNSPYIWDSAFQEMVFFNAEQGKVFNSVLSLNGAPIYIVPAGWALLLALGAHTGLQNRSVFIMFSGFAFCVVLLLIPPQQGWYYWIIPFFAFFFAKEHRITLLTYAATQILYLAYFLVSPSSDYMQVLQPLLGWTPPLGTTFVAIQKTGVDAQLISDLAITFLQCSLVVICIQIYIHGLVRYSDHKLTGLPFLVGVGGNSGVGKSTLSNALQDVFLERNVTLLQGDDQHRWNRGHAKWNEFTHLNPKANHLHSENDSLRKLLNGQDIQRQHYDHNTGRFTSEAVVKPKRLILLEGLHPFFLENQRGLFDLKIYLEPEETLATHWKIRRDQSKRDYSAQQVMQQIAARSLDSEKFITAQKAYADVVIRCIPTKTIENPGCSDEYPELSYELSLQNSLNVDPAVSLIEEATNIKITHNFPSIDMQKLQLSGTIKPEELDTLIRYLDEKFQEVGVRGNKWPHSLFGVIVFLLIYLIFERAEYAQN